MNILVNFLSNFHSVSTPIILRFLPAKFSHPTKFNDDNIVSGCHEQQKSKTDKVVRERVVPICQDKKNPTQVRFGMAIALSRFFTAFVNYAKLNYITMSPPGFLFVTFRP